MTGASIETKMKSNCWYCSLNGLSGGGIIRWLKLTKKMKAIKAGVDSTKAYEINEAIALLKQFATAKFVESVDVAVNLGIDPRKSDQNVRGATVLPHGTGREVRVAVFTQGAKRRCS